MKILGIETSCDETAMAVLKIKGKKNPCFSVLSNVISSQVKLHAKYGGVYPTLAKREHQKNLPFVLKKTLKQAGLVNLKLDLIAVTVGPGLEPCLWTGVNFAKELAEKNNLPIVPVNHIEAHIVANFIGGSSKINFPAVCLVVSGGHTQLVLMKGLGRYQIIGETRDDAAGECFDKTARVLGLGYPGGPAIANQSSKANKASRGRASTSFSVCLPRPMIHQKNYDFSFSGLKTAVLYDFKNRPTKIRKSKQYIQEMAAEIQQAIIDVLIRKTIKAAKDYKAKTIILCGGVAANDELRKQLEKRIKEDLSKTRYLKPDIKLCTDNAIMVAIAGYFNQRKAKNWKKIKANANLRI